MRRMSTPTGSPRRPADSAEVELDLSALGAAIWRRKTAILAVTLLAAILSYAVVSTITPRYKSEARVLIENRETAYNQPQGDRTPERDRTLIDPEAVQSQVQLALSRDLARAVTQKLKFAERPEFNPSAGSIIDGLLAMVGIRRESRLSVEERVLERYFERLSVYQVDKSRVIAIEFQSEDADFASRVANAVAEGYLQLQQQAKQDSIQQANLWLSGEIDRLRARVAEAESKVEEFRSRSNLYIGPNNNALSAQSLGELNTQLANARTRKADAETKARLIRGILRSGRPVETSDVLNSELIRRLNEQRVTLRAQLAEQSSTLLALHPRIKELKAQISDLEAQTRIEADKIARSFENDARLASAQAESILLALDQQKKQATALGGQDVQLRALERDAKSQRDLLEVYLSRYRDTAARASPEAVPADARVISRASASAKPHFPKKLPIVAIATLAAFLLMICFIATGELLRGTVYRTAGPAELTAAEDLPVPVVPEHPKSWLAGPRTGPLMEHVRTLGNGVVVVSRAGPEPSERLALDLARDLAAEGKRVLFVDLDVERSISRTIVTDKRAPGLSDLLEGTVKFGEAIHRDPSSRVHVLSVGRAAHSTESLLKAERLAIILGAIGQAYDHAIVAAPDLLPLADAARLARFSRGVLLIAAEGNESVGAAASDALAANGFVNVAVVAVGSDAPAEKRASLAAA